MGLVPLVPAPVVAQVSRSSKQAQLRRLLRGCEVAVLDEAGAHTVGALLGKSHASDLADASVVSLASALTADVVTSDRRDIERLLAVIRRKLRIVAA
jgi:hypothetical protein